MLYIYTYHTPASYSDITLTSDGTYLTGLWFKTSPYEKNNQGVYLELPIFKETGKWLDIYFSGKIPTFTPKYKIVYPSSFKKEIIEIIKDIPFGKTITYGEIAKKCQKEKMCSQAVGHAISWNPILLIIPCHRVIGKNGNLTGYAGGLANKQALLEHEKQN